MLVRGVVGQRAVSEVWHRLMVVVGDGGERMMRGGDVFFLFCFQVIYIHM